jgi:PAS domain S-box-containing protein
MKRFDLSTVMAAMRHALPPAEPECCLELARVRESEARLKQVTDIAPVLIWMSGPDTLLNYFNRRWLDFTGRPIHTQLGNGWTEGMHADDRPQYDSIYRDAFANHQPFQTEFRLRRSDGQYRWLLDIGIPTYDQQGSFTGFIGSCLDITNDKNPDEALASISGRLIEAQEQERSRLARELHDDINQRLALLAIELEQLRLNPPYSRKALARRIDDLQQTTLEISRDVQALSHKLHSSKLDFLGLVPAFSSFCREFAQQMKVAVNFANVDIPGAIPRDISLCLFRILQEASHNVVKHSGAESFDVELRGIGSQVHLTVRDAGKGFDPTLASSTRGLGLVSMRERLNLIGGTLSVRSGLTRGTEILARIPLSRQIDMPVHADRQDHPDAGL